ncbi:uncharacterized protein LOC127844610 isoform X2 [Dreissena polymorpha]|uniref:uncharacterized protein LOC127844610 isoform X2 n=1 Tax=Dreissena polymorpha TaxID=45954 RepID=UPI00226463CB|nr:uncharacterized protein LOC127844610 isoform X2 [Dreissena polymorpha]
MCRLRINEQDTMVIYYHHTNAEATEKILESQVLKQSSDIFGTGVFLSKMGPGTSFEKLFVNNYEDNYLSSSRMKSFIRVKGKDADVCFELHLPDDVCENFVEKYDYEYEAENEEKKKEKRRLGVTDVYMFKGGIDLSGIDFIIYWRNKTQ